ncbi:MAG: metal ABC transporter ATP-binding protein [Prochlorotrichaceae cyanobacterium]
MKRLSGMFQQSHSGGDSVLGSVGNTGLPQVPLGAAASPVLRVQGLTVQRQKQVAVQNVSFSLLPGTDTAVVGPNGAGKSTLIKALLGILPHQAGEVWMMGHRLSPTGQLPNTVRQDIAYLPQSFLFDRRLPMTVEEWVGLGWDSLGWQLPWQGGNDRRQAIRRALSTVDAWPLRQKLLSSLSGGQTKRVLLAYCLVRPRRLLILDEAPAGLDLRSEWDFYQLLKQLKQEQGWAILQVSHNLEMVQRNCDHVICLNQMIRCQGSPHHTLTDENLSLTYGVGFVRYHHACHIQENES